MERALIIQKPWVDLILDNIKIWEMRSTKTNVRGKIGLIEAGSGLIVGEAILAGCGEPLDNFNIGHGHHLHKVDDFSLLEKWRYPWILSSAKRYEEPIPYQHPRGAVIWVKLDS